MLSILRILFPLLFINFLYLSYMVNAYAYPKVEVHGLITLDAQVTSKLSALDGNQTWPITPAIPLNSQTVYNHYQTRLDARYSQLSVTVSDKINECDVFGKIEIDANTNTGTALLNNTRNVEIRLAYFEVKPPNHWYFRFGQYWTLALNRDIGYPINKKLIDRKGPSGSLWGRQPQLQVGYIQPLGAFFGHLLFAADIEQQSASDGLATFPLPNAISQGNGMYWPLIVGKVGWYDYLPLQIEAAVFASENRVIFTENQTAKKAFGAQISFESRFGDWSLYGSFNYTDGINRLDNNSDFPDVALYLNNFNQIQNVCARGGYLGVSSLWRDTVFYAIYGIHKANTIGNTTFSAAVSEDDVIHIPWQLLPSFQVGAVYTAFKNYDIGLELKRWWLTAVDNQKGSLNQYTLQFNYRF